MESGKKKAEKREKEKIIKNGSQPQRCRQKRAA
jgi:hypothetical protein